MGLLVGEMSKRNPGQSRLGLLDVAGAKVSVGDVSKVLDLVGEVSKYRPHGNGDEHDRAERSGIALTE